jgi:hypothetical protein
MAPIGRSGEHIATNKTRNNNNNGNNRGRRSSTNVSVCYDVND